MNYWIFKTEPSTYGIDDLKKDKISEWSGIRNYQVRNLIRDVMAKRDQVLLYHSSTKNIGIVGLAEIVSDAYPDTEQFKKGSHYFDQKSKKENPTWLSRDITYKKKFLEIITLQTLRNQKKLVNMRLLQKGNRLSISPLSKEEFEYIVKLAE